MKRVFVSYSHDYSAHRNGPACAHENGSRGVMLSVIGQGVLTGMDPMRSGLMRRSLRG